MINNYNLKVAYTKKNKIAEKAEKKRNFRRKKKQKKLCVC